MSSPDGYTLSPVDHDPFYEDKTSPNIRQVAPKAEGGPSDQGYFARMWGSEPDMVHVPPNTKYPDALDAHFAKQFDQTYGDEVAKYLQPGSKTVKMSSNNIIEKFGDITGRAFGKATATATTLEERDTILKNWIASQKSPVAALGFDPGHTVFTPKLEDEHLNLAGFYRPVPDTMWYNATDGEDVVVHESMHRGIEQLRKNDMLPKSYEEQEKKIGSNAEEFMVRALKERYFGDIEKGHGEKGDEQVEAGKWFDKYGGGFHQAVDDIETAAQKLIATKGKTRQ